MKTTINPYYYDKMLSLLNDALIYVHYPDSNDNFAALLNSSCSAQYLSPGCSLAAP